MCPTGSERVSPKKPGFERLLEPLGEEPPESVCEVLVCFGTSPASLLERLSSALRRRWPHWAVVLSYGEKALYCTGQRDPRTGCLVGTATWRTAAQLDAMNVHKMSLGEHTVSPQQLCDAMTGLCEDGKYRVVHNDSQAWAIRLLNRLSLDIPD
ncbi:uncharacterized protein [Dermacentor andersoni]|nr:uncharacterized protein LOC126522256 isoform X2 [Dermacentor andersoni]XP_050026940.1 uncharacterized protein LOC126522256 isoform X2 [Dermacentor andersoni]XP_054922278.1 uncharacterized protein LOC126522256 isoform X2 [Dermacentor andersoni]